jgi:Archaeal fructose-1,6-bisphosphatase and related enzymes of inositol monophosphatase family
MQPAVINIFEKAARKAGRVLIRDFGEIENLQIKSKGVGDFVTNTDLKVEKLLIETLSYYYPNAIFLTEEQENKENIENQKEAIVIDPIDGTSNFIHGIPFVAIIIARVVNNEKIDGIIYNPILNDLIGASKGKGA